MLAFLLACLMENTAKILGEAWNTLGTKGGVTGHTEAFEVGTPNKSSLFGTPRHSVNVTGTNIEGLIQLRKEFNIIMSVG